MKQKYFVCLYLICSIFGITPFYSFKKSQLIKQSLNKIWLIILLVYKSLLITGYFLLRFPKFEREHSLITVKVLEHPSHLSYWMMPFSTVFILLVYNSKKWEEFLVKFSRINEVLPWKIDKKVMYYAKHVLNFVLNVIIFFKIFSDREYFNFDECVIYNIWYIMYSNLEEMFWLYTNIFTNEVILNIRYRYEALNGKLVQIINKSVENKFMNKEVVFITVKQIQKIKSLYRDINDLVERANLLLGWPIFCLMAYTLLNTLSILNGLIADGDLQWIGADSIEIILIIVSISFLDVFLPFSFFLF